MKMFKHIFALAFAVAVMSITSQAFAFHHDYANNTNNCNYCHQLHNSTEDMLLTDSVANDGTTTCLGCHDKTTSYGVKAHNKNAGTMIALDTTNVPGANKGTPTGNTATAGSSAHMVGVATLSQAPGGNKASSSAEEWKSTLGCTSCHSGHPGEQNDPNVTYMRYGIVSYKDDAKQTNFDTSTSTKVYAGNAIPTSKDTNYILVATQARNVTYTESGRTKYGAFYSKYMQKLATADGVTLGDNTVADWVLMPYIWVPVAGKTAGGQYIPVNAELSTKGSLTIGSATDVQIDKAGSFLYSKSHSLTNANGTLSADVTFRFVISPFEYGKTVPVGTDGKLYDGAGTDVTNAKFKATTDSTDKSTYATGGTDTGFKGMIDNRSYWDVTSPNYKPGAGNALTIFCLQCHTDYMSTSHGNLTTTYGTDAKYRHTNLNSNYDGSGDRLSCTRCHFAHGTDSLVLRDAVGNNAATITGQADGVAYVKDANVSSALKRYTGFSACLQCHGTSIGQTNADVTTGLSTGVTGATGVTAPF